ncbi:pentatricopeptide repeat-containing protein At1g80880, mitochondrial isoform X2 [Benincasa hispida]|uniref:pentatricopeptide repeat-containing protein At1g80880, mitochondrial isoform X2 n=1 Tax=Benincasa hispida TaxID=102211 RepID=UPI0019018611|nr:pentatricopeptide repeat-containing protein At1g80880, mitochondrial isoform X2 [Benincasa hispida]XP_038896357.1 pentatricopeptide repeat-containing protein At1g80880, mitochondrial isoform X2 [Benincasa hispida]
MASLSSIARRLCRNHPLQFHQLRHLIYFQIPDSPFQAFHRTICLHSQAARQFSALPSVSQKDGHPFHFDTGRFQNYRPNDARNAQFVELLKRVARLPSEAEAVAALDEFDVQADRHLVYSAIWVLRDDWKSSFLAFKWGEKWGSVDEEICNLMIWVLGNHKKFSTAWCLIRELHGSVMDSRQAMLVMIDRYAYANEASKAIKTFHMMEKFRLTPDQEAFHALLSSLCKYGNIEEAEEFMFVNKKLFPLETESFNIILNGWCNVSVNVFEAKRIWREMSKCCILPDSTSYTHMISCFSKTGNLFDSLRLYDEIKKRDWVPSLEVYNSLAYVLTRENCFSEALKILEKIKEIGLQPDSTTYNSLISPLCEMGKLDEAKDVLTMMTEDNIGPTIKTYHSLIQGADSEMSFELLKQMRHDGLGPTEATFVIMFNKSFELEQPDYALKTWVEMKRYKVLPNSEHYSIMIQGLATYGLLKQARELYDEMTLHGFIAHPKIKMLLKEPDFGGIEEARQQVRHNKKDKFFSHRKVSMMRWKSHKQQSTEDASFE